MNTHAQTNRDAFTAGYNRALRDCLYKIVEHMIYEMKDPDRLNSEGHVDPFFWRELTINDYTDKALEILDGTINWRNHKYIINHVMDELAPRFGLDKEEV